MGQRMRRNTGKMIMKKLALSRPQRLCMGRKGTSILDCISQTSSEKYYVILDKLKTFQTTVTCVQPTLMITVKKALSFIFIIQMNKLKPGLFNDLPKITVCFRAGLERQSSDSKFRALSTIPGQHKEKTGMSGSADQTVTGHLIKPCALGK